MKTQYFHFFILYFFLCLIACQPPREENNPYAHLCGPEDEYFFDTWSWGWCVGAPRVDSNAMFILEGFGHDTVMLYVQGGPRVELDAKTVNYYEQYMDVAYVQQGQMLQGFKQEDENINDNWAKAKVDISNSATMLNGAIQHFRSQDKTVVLFGVSWGCFIIQQWLSEYPNTADKIVLGVGRLFANEALTQKYYPAYTDETITYLRQQVNKNYMELLDDKDLSNVIYIHAEFDQSTLPLTQEELDWLANKGIPTHKIRSDHFAAVEAEATIIIMDWIFRE